MVTYLTVFKAQNDNGSKGLELIFSKLQRNTPSEPGCISYKIYTEASNPWVSYLIETWRSQQEFEAHGEVVAASSYVEQASLYTAEPFETIRILEKSEIV